MPQKKCKDLVAGAGLFVLVAFGCGPINVQAGRLCLAAGMSVSAALFAISVIGTPIVEEGAKRIGIAAGMPWLFVAIFAGVEFLLYVAMGADTVMRIPAAVMHVGTMYVQIRTTEISRAKRGRVADAFLWGGWLVAVLIHAFFNWAVLNAPA